MSISTSTSGYSSESQWDPVTRNTNSQNETRFLVTEAQPYRLNPVNCNGSREQCIYSVPKLPNVNNVNCINSNMYFNTPNYVNTGAPIRQEMRFQKTFNGFHNPVMAPNPRNGHIVASVNTWGHPTASGDRMISRPMNVSKPRSGGVKKPKRIRTAFTSQQMMELENEYARTRYLDRSRRIELSEVLHLNERTIKIWFQNRRMKEKKDRAESLEDTEATSTTESCSENGPVQMIVYEPYPHNGMGRLDGGNYADSFQQVNAPVVTQNVSASMTTGCNDVNCYPSFVLDNTSHLLQTFQQDSNALPVHCQQMKQEYHIDSSKNTLNDFKEEIIIENSSEPSENSTNDASKIEDEQNWDLSWIRSIHIEEELQE